MEGKLRQEATNWITRSQSPLSIRVYTYALLVHQHVGQTSPRGDRETGAEGFSKEILLSVRSMLWAKKFTFFKELFNGPCRGFKKHRPQPGIGHFWSNEAWLPPLQTSTERQWQGGGVGGRTHCKVELCCFLAG